MPEGSRQVFLAVLVPESPWDDMCFASAPWTHLDPITVLDATPSAFVWDVILSRSEIVFFIAGSSAPVVWRPVHAGLTGAIVPAGPVAEISGFGTAEMAKVDIRTLSAEGIEDTPMKGPVFRVSGPGVFRPEPAQCGHDEGVWGCFCEVERIFKVDTDGIARQQSL